MDKYKHACPKCGQRIEYTIDYCGQQIGCPICHTPIVFPEAPAPTATQKLRLQRDINPQKSKSNRFVAILKAVRDFPHWRMVVTCLVPFFLIGGLLLGASYLRKTSSPESTEIPKAVTVTVGSDGWKKMTDLGQVEQVVQYHLQTVTALTRTLAQEQAQAAALHDHYHGMTLDGGTYAMVMKQRDDLQKRITLHQQQMNAEDAAFRESFELYKKLGGQVDYYSQYHR
jgi:hypothetical protein